MEAVVDKLSSRCCLFIVCEYMKTLRRDQDHDMIVELQHEDLMDMGQKEHACWLERLWHLNPQFAQFYNIALTTT